ncbi:ribonuclease H2 non-catalytic subunit-domain-containing protein [Tirmania nivea]|nr:ribonuclease H2 non-catalytic subunit-domain-containing protein [Tirmania nivea]
MGTWFMSRNDSLYRGTVRASTASIHVTLQHTDKGSGACKSRASSYFTRRKRQVNLNASPQPQIPMPSTHLPITPSPAVAPPPTATLHLLPAKLQTASPADAGRYWRPTPLPKTEAAAAAPGPEDDSGNPTEPAQEATFRGRRLLGQEVLVPEGYTGLVLATIPNPSPPPRGNAGEEAGDEDEEEAPQNVLTPLAQFRNVVVWGHDELPTAVAAGGPGGDLVMRGVQEWLAWAGMIHGIEDDDEKEEEHVLAGV